MTTTAPPYDGIREGAAELALRRHGFDGQRLTKLARKVANDWLRAKGATLGDRYEDLVSSLCIVGLNGALRYDPTMYQRSYGSNGGEPFASFIADLMERRIVDWYRSKAEGNGDRRYGNDDRVVYSSERLEDEPDPEIDFDKQLTQDTIADWKRGVVRANELYGMNWSFGEYCKIAIDGYTKAINEQYQRTAA